MSDNDKRLTGECQRVGDVAKRILDWLGDSADIVAAERVALLHEVYRTETTAATLARALDEGPSVAVVGPSRAGKTQLLAALVEPGGGQVSVRFEGIREQIGFMKQLCPEGARTGTAAAVRLTSRKRAASQNFPVVIRLLSMGDLVKILGALFIAGAEPRDLEPNARLVDEVVAEARAHVASEAVAGLGEEDIWDIRHYFTTRFGEEPLVRTLLTSGYWERLTGLVGFLANADRARALSVLWGGNPLLTRTFETLANAILGLGCGREARAALDSVLGLDSRTGRFQRRPDTILSAATLAGLGQPDADTLVVANEHGQWVSLPRPVLAAIVAEVRLPVADAGTELIERADIIELPSIDGRSGGGHPMRELARDPATLGAVLMRAKASYLLERYTEEQAITAMAVCIDPGNPRLRELGGLVTAWIEKSHGVDAGRRERQAAGLFVCLTKLDKEFVEPSRRQKERRIDWDAHVTAALIEGLGRNQSWPAEWTPSRAFDNLCLLRLPAQKAKHLLNYASDGRELSFKPEQTGRIERARRDFLASSLVRRHVGDPETVWREAFELNDGGATLIAQSLADVCDARAKERHVLSDLTELGRSLRDRLQRYHVSDDVGLQQDRRRMAALIAMRWLRQAAEERRFGQLIRGLQLSDGEFNDVLQRHTDRAGLDGRMGTAAKLNGNGAVHSAADVSEAARTYAAHAMTHWVASVRLFAQADRIAHTLGVPRQGLLLIVDELIAGAARTGLEGRIATEIEDLITDAPDEEARVMRAALVAANLIGDFVMWLGFDDVRSNAHPRRKGKAGRPIFPPRDGTDAFAVNGSGEGGSDRAFLADWSQAFLALVADNAGELARGARDGERNRRLGELLSGLDISL